MSRVGFIIEAERGPRSRHLPRLTCDHEATSNGRRACVQETLDAMRHHTASYYESTQSSDPTIRVLRGRRPGSGDNSVIFFFSLSSAEL